MASTASPDPIPAPGEHPVFDAAQKFASDVSKAFAVNFAFQPEDQLKSPVRALVEAAGTALQKTITSVTEVHALDKQGRPDIGVDVSGLLTGYIELKAPGKGADPFRFRGADKAQWEKFATLPNIIYTDGIQWALYRTGERVGDIVRLGDVVKVGEGSYARNSARTSDNAAGFSPVGADRTILSPRAGESTCAAMSTTPN